MCSKLILSIAVMAALSDFSLAILLNSDHHLSPRDPNEVLVSIAPTSASCTNAPVASECATAAQAVQPILDGFAKYNISTAGEQAALLSWMAFESDDFKYNINHYPGTPGQGTRCMISPSYVKEYVASLPALTSEAADAQTPAEVLDLVLEYEYSFASASWFMSSQCTSDVRDGLSDGSDEGWEAFVTSCVQTTVTDDRQAYWERAKSALGV